MPTETSADLTSLLLIVAVAAGAPLLAGLSRRVLIPTVVLEVLLGIIIGPQVLDFAELDPFIYFLSQIGLAFLFFLAGLEIQLSSVRGRPVTLASTGWVLSLAIGMTAAALLLAADVVNHVVYVGVALATTALGVLTPVLRDSGLTGTRLGTLATAAGSVGELYPIIVIAVFLSSTDRPAHQIAVLLVFLATALAAATVALRARPPHVLRTIAETLHRSGQLAVRLSMLILIFLVWLAVEFDIDFILGALAAGLIVGLVARGETGTVVRDRIEGVGYGVFVPIFFIVSGLRFDLDALLDSTKALVLLPIAVLLILLARGLPALLLYRHDVDGRGRTILAFLSATTLPLIIAITDIGVRNGDLASDVAAALVGAGMVSVLLFPAVALAFARSTPGTAPA